MSATWQCASIRPGTMGAPSSRGTCAPGPAAARISPGSPTAAIRPSRTSIARAVSPPGCIVTTTASSMTSSTRRTLRRAPAWPAGCGRGQFCGRTPRSACGQAPSRSGVLPGGGELAGPDGGGLVLADDEVAVAERRDAADDQGQGQGLNGQVQHSGLDVLAEQEQP